MNPPKEEKKIKLAKINMQAKENIVKQQQL